MGLVLNRRTESEVEEAVPSLSGLVDGDEMVHEGGPVQPDSVIVLGDFEEPAEAGTHAGHPNDYHALSCSRLGPPRDGVQVPSLSGSPAAPPAIVGSRWLVRGVIPVWRRRGRGGSLRLVHWL